MPKKPKVPPQVERLSIMMKRHLARLAWSDDQLVAEIKMRHATKGGLTTIKRYKDGTATTEPTLQTLGYIGEALGFSDGERNWVLEGDAAKTPGFPSAKDQTDQWQQLLAYLNRQSNLSYEVQQRREAAKAALAGEDYEQAKAELTEVANLLYRPAAYHAEEYARALAALGALAFTEFDYAEARVQYGKAIGIRPLPDERLERYRHSYRVASSACMATAHTEAEARAILQEIKDNGVTPNVVSYSTLLNFVKSEAEARAILQGMKDNGVTPDVVSYSTLLNFVKSEAEARAILQEMKDNGVTPDVVSYSTLLNFVKSEAEARAILQEMTDNGVTPNVVSYNSLLNFVKSEAEARAILQEMTDNGVTPDVVSYSTLLNFVKSEAEARAILQEMTDNGVTPNVVSYNSLLNFVKSEAEARAILQEMTDNGVTPDVVSYSTLLNFVKSEAEARAILQEMTDNGVTPNEITVITVVNKTVSFENALGVVDFCLENGFFAGRGAFEAAYSKPIAHLSAKELLTQYHNRKYKFDTALEGPINQYRKTRQEDQALLLTLVAPHVAAAQKLYREKYDLCRAFFEAEIKSGNDEDNLYYAFGIAAALNSDWKNAKKNLKIARERSYADKRSDHIKRLLSEAPVR